jgi:hypothetical protein
MELAVPFEEIAQTADLIFVGTADGGRSFLNDGKTMIFTEIDFTEIEVIHASKNAVGILPGAITLSFAGGTVDDITVSVSCVPKIEQGSRYVIFVLHDGERYLSPIVGGAQGIYEVLKHAGTGEESIVSLGGRALTGFEDGEPVFSTGAVARKGDGTFSFEPRSGGDALQRYQEPPVSVDGRSTAAPSSFEQPLLSDPMRLRNFIDHVRNVSLQKRLGEPRLKKAGTGSFFRSRDGSVVEEPLQLTEPGGIDLPRLMEKRRIGQSASQDMCADIASDGSRPSYGGGTLGACGAQNIPIRIELVPEGWWSYETISGCISNWHSVMTIFEKEPSDGYWGDNGENEFGGWISNDVLSRVYDFRWGNAIAVAISTVDSGVECGRIYQSDVFFNPAYSWTDNSDFAVGNCRVVLLRPVVMHETGHVWGEQCGKYVETYDYDAPTVMHGYHCSIVEDGSGVHVPDAYLIRRHYSRQKGINTLYKDVGIESYYASNGLNNSTTDRGLYRPNDDITLRRVTVENMSYSSVSEVTVDFYLSRDRTITDGDRHIAKIAYRELAGETYRVIDCHTRLPNDVPPGEYYVGATVSMATGFLIFDWWKGNNSTYFYDKITVRNDPPVCHLPEDQTIFQQTPETVRLRVWATDPDNNLAGEKIVSGPGKLSNGYWVYTPRGSEEVTVTVRFTDACGAHSQGSFSVSFKTPADFAGVNVTPNPFIPSRGHSAITFFGEKLAGARIDIFNKAGGRVKTLRPAGDAVTVTWDAKNDDGAAVASGVYIWVATGNSGKRSQGKFAVIK